MRIADEAARWRDALRDMRARHPVAFEHRVYEGPRSARIDITMVTIDSRDGVTPIRPTKTRDLPTFTTVRAAREYLREAMRAMVLHELDEWIEVGDARPYYPHPL